MTDMSLDCSNSRLLVEEIGRLRATVARLEQRIEDLDRLAHHDALVPLMNRRGFVRQLEKLIDRAARYGDTGALLLIDHEHGKSLRCNHFCRSESRGPSTDDDEVVHVSTSPCG